MQQEINLHTVATKLFDSAVLFNRISYGKKVDDLTIDELLKKLDKQYEITLEEVNEALDAIKYSDVVKYYDAVADILYTMTFFWFLFERLDDVCDIQHSRKDEFKKLIEDSQIVLKREDIDFNLLNEVADLVIENNQMKFTTIKEEFDTWESEFTRTSIVVDGFEYFYLVDDDLKVRKRDGFPKVDLSFIKDEIPYWNPNKSNKEEVVG